MHCSSHMFINVIPVRIDQGFSNWVPQALYLIAHSHNLAAVKKPKVPVLKKKTTIKPRQKSN